MTLGPPRDCFVALLKANVHNFKVQKSEKKKRIKCIFFFPLTRNSICGGYLFHLSVCKNTYTYLIYAIDIYIYI